MASPQSNMQKLDDDSSSDDSQESNPSVWEGNFPRKMMDLQWHFSCGPLRVAQCTEQQWNRLHATYKEVLPQPDGTMKKVKQKIRHVHNDELARQVQASGVAKAKPERKFTPLPPKKEVSLEEMLRKFEEIAVVPLPKKPEKKKGWAPGVIGGRSRNSGGEGSTLRRPGAPASAAASDVDDSSSIFSTTTVPCSNAGGRRGPYPLPPVAGSGGPRDAGQHQHPQAPRESHGSRGSMTAAAPSLHARAHLESQLLGLPGSCAAAVKAADYARSGEGGDAGRREGSRDSGGGGGGGPASDPPLPAALLERQKQLVASIGPPGSVPLTRAQLEAIKASYAHGRCSATASRVSCASRSEVCGRESEVGTSSRVSVPRVAASGAGSRCHSRFSKTSTTVSALNETLAKAKAQTAEANSDLAAAKAQLDALEAAIGIV